MYKINIVTNFLMEKNLTSKGQIDESSVGGIKRLQNMETMGTDIYGYNHWVTSIDVKQSNSKIYLTK